MEEALLNKYFRGKGPSPKIYFKEEEIAEITYYLKQSPTNIKNYSNEHENTAEE